MPQPRISIPQPCHEAWAAMTPTAQGRHCTSCQKTVVDFSRQTDAEIHAYFKRAGRDGVCGRFNISQVERPLQAGKARAETTWRTWLALAFAVWAGREGATPAALAQPPTEQRQPQPPAYLRGADKTQLQLRGFVIDSATNERMPGVSVLMEGSTYGTSTDAEGQFELVFPAWFWDEGRVLSIKNLGYQEIKMALQSKPSLVGEQLKIVMAVDKKQAGEAVVMALGGVFYRPPAPPARRTFWFWLTRPFRR